MMRELLAGFMMSDAHNWVQTLPLSDRIGACIICGVRGSLRDLPIGGCHVRAESASAGFRAIGNPWKPRADAQSKPE